MRSSQHWLVVPGGGRNRFTGEVLDFLPCAWQCPGGLTSVSRVVHYVSVLGLRSQIPTDLVAENNNFILSQLQRLGVHVSITGSRPWGQQGRGGSEKDPVLALSREAAGSLGSWARPPI